MACARNHERGFTLMELLVVVAIVGILATIAIPQIQGVICDSRVSAVKSDVNTIRTALAQCEVSTNVDDCTALRNLAEWLPRRITDPDEGRTWSLSDTDDDGIVDRIAVENVGCEWTDSTSSPTSGRGLRYDIGEGMFEAVSGGSG